MIKKRYLVKISNKTEKAYNINKIKKLVQRIFFVVTIVEIHKVQDSAFHENIFPHWTVVRLLKSHNAKRFSH